MSGGLVALSYLQRGLETTSGTAVAATAIQPILGGWLKEHIDREFPNEMRNSFIRHYRNFPLATYVEIGGLTIAPTFTDLAWWCSLFLKGLGAGAPRKPTGSGPTNTSVYTYAHTPTVASDDLNTATLEMGDDVQNFQVPYVLGNGLQLGWSASGPMTVSMNLLGQRAVAAAKTAALSVVGDEDIVGPLTTVKIDTSTIGTTAVTTVKEMSWGIDNGWSQEFVLDGNLYARGAHRSDDRTALLSATLLFSSATEYTSVFQNYAAGGGTPRKIRIETSGTNIATSAPATNRKMTVDWYGVWEDADFDTINGQRAVKFSGRSQYDATATNDWGITILNALATIS